MDDDSLLSLENDPELLQNLLQNANLGDLSGLPGLNLENEESQTVLPKPGFCLKTKNKPTSEKIFVNVCQTDCLPVVKDISDEELWKVLECMDGHDYRIPLSLGEPHAEVDKNGTGCTVYDVIVHPSVLIRSESSQVFNGFLLTIILEGLEFKYNMELDRNYVILKNRKSMGIIQKQNVRKQSRPRIVEMDDPSNVPGIKPVSRPLISEQKETLSRIPEPKYTIVQDPPVGHPDFLVAEICLPDVKTAAGLTLDVGEDRFLLETRSRACRLDIYLPYDLEQESVGAQFNKSARVLTVTMPVQPIANASTVT